MKIPILINNRNLLTWPKAMVNKIKQFNNVGDIIIIDNGSTYEPLLEWYNTKPCDILKIHNTGHEAPWKCGILNDINSKYYVVTDPDLGLDEIPNDALDYLKTVLIKYDLPKIGFGLDYSNIRLDSPYFQHLNIYEKNRWLDSMRSENIFFDVVIDTTFALYSKNEYFIGGSSVGKPYVAKHYPWYLTYDEIKTNVEFKYYLDNANSSSSFNSIYIT